MVTIGHGTFEEGEKSLPLMSAEVQQGIKMIAGQANSYR